MGETSHELTPSLDDGIPYYPTISVVAGTDDGRLHRGENPPNGAILDYWLMEAQEEGAVAISIEDGSGRRVALVDGTTRKGINRSRCSWGRRGRCGRRLVRRPRTSPV